MTPQTAQAHNYLHDHYSKLRDTRLQRKFRNLAPMPVGVVFIEWPDMTDEEVRDHFRTMKRLGFNCLKQVMARPVEAGGRGYGKLLHMALDEGILPWWFGTGGYEDITPELLKKLGLDPDMPVDEALQHPKMLAHQEKLMRERIDREDTERQAKRQANRGKRRQKGAAMQVPGVVPTCNAYELEEDEVEAFIGWVKKTYGDLDEVKKAWNAYHLGNLHVLDCQTWEDLARDLHEYPRREYRFLRDVMRFKADQYLEHRIRPMIERRDETDPEAPVRRGGEMSLFLPFASRGTDMEGIAEMMAEGGSFYPSTHPAWHFEEVDFEYPRMVYVYDSLAHDWAKGVWTATWESTGGPQYFSGGKAPFVPEVRDKFPGFTIDKGAIQQFMFSHLAAGYRGYGIWCWNPRIAGWEAGEFALTDRNNKPTPRAVEAGRIGAASQRLRRELWDANKEPVVGILQDWENEAFWAAMSATGRDMYKSVPVKARVGASRALINANVPWEYVTAKNLRAGLGPRYRVIYLPAFIYLGATLLEDLIAYVKQGGRVVMDMPSAYFDEYGRLLRTDEGSLFEQLFGVEMHEYAFANNVKFEIDGAPLEGFTVSMTPTRAKVLSKYNTGDAAITEAALGDGAAVLLGAQASHGCFRPGHELLENLLVQHALGPHESPYACDGAIVYRLAAPRADHYFFINDGPARQVTLDTKEQQYVALSDPVSQASLELGAPIALPMYGGRWVRMEKSL